jgi:prepilin-type N-terminal cleavage/methylation domain-containing protein
MPRRSRRPAAGREGFTLIEVVVALTLAALLMLGARALFEQLGAHAEALVGAAADADREANGDALLRALVGAAETSPDPERRFEGTEEGVRFSTWCESPGGWLERCAVTLGFVHADTARVLALEAGAGDPVVLRRGFRDGHLIYLRAPEEGGSWVRGWSSVAITPLAVGVVVDGDTAILRIGERG